MKSAKCFPSLTLLAALVMLVLPSMPSFSQSSSSGSDQTNAPAVNNTDKTTKKEKKQEATAKPFSSMAPFSHLALSGGVSLMGVNLQVATNVNRYLNLRGTGNFFNYSANNITVSDFSLNGKVNFATASASLDFYPFPGHGFRLSPGAFFYNQNQITASASGVAGSDISLEHIKYYTDTGAGASPMAVNAALGLNARPQAFSMTTGWGNMIPRKGGHWSVPFEIGAVFTGVPTVNMVLSGSGCTNPQDALTNGPSCVNLATNPIAQNLLSQQIAKFKSDLNPLQVYPIFSFGVSYSFRIR